MRFPVNIPAWFVIFQVIKPTNFKWSPDFRKGNADLPSSPALARLKGTLGAQIYGEDTYLALAGFLNS
jgi:hypothetical protein